MRENFKLIQHKMVDLLRQDIAELASVLRLYRLFSPEITALLFLNPSRPLIYDIFWVFEDNFSIKTLRFLFILSESFVLVRGGLWEGHL